MRKKFFTSLGIVLALTGIGLIPATAATMTVGLSKTSFEAAEDSIKVTLGNFPTKAGIYLQQCVEPTAGSRPAICNKVTQLWITNDPFGSFLPTADITMKVVAKFDNVDCTTSKCGIFARLDHTAGPDTSEDQFQAITFNIPAVTTGGTVTAAPTVTIQKQSIPRIIKSISVTKKRLALPLQSSGMVNIQYRSASNSVCTVKGNVVTLRKAGTCRIQAFAGANAQYSMVAENLNLRITK